MEGRVAVHWPSLQHLYDNAWILWCITPEKAFQ